MIAPVPLPTKTFKLGVKSAFLWMPDRSVDRLADTVER